MPGVSLLENFVSATAGAALARHRLRSPNSNNRRNETGAECTAAEAADVVAAEDVCATSAGMSRPSAQVMRQLVWLVEAWWHKSKMPLVVMRSCMA